LPNKLTGGLGNDRLVGAAGNDQLLGVDGNDTLEGGTNNDTVNGGNGGDLLYGLEGADQLLGGGESDNLLGGAGNDNMDGGPGDDNHFFNGGWGSETVLDSGGSDWIRANNTAPAPPGVTIKLASTTGPEVTDGTNTFNWGGNVIENAQLGPGNDRISQNSSNNQMADFVGGSDTYQGYGSGPASGNDIIGDFTGSPGDRLNLSNFNSSQVQMQFGNSGPGTPATGLVIKFADGSRIDIVDYFDGTSTLCAVGPGPGLVETISFSNEPNVGFARTKQLIGCSTTAGTSGSTLRAAASTGDVPSGRARVGGIEDVQAAVPVASHPSATAAATTTYEKR